MVLNKSKWDKKAKYHYMRKHGITNPKPVDNTPRPKWSSKRRDAEKNPGRIVLEDSDSEWDSDADEALINHFYPQLGEAELTKEQKEKIKQQILEDFQKEQETEKEEVPVVEEELDGLYLGSEENRAKEMSSTEETPNTINLREILAKASDGKSKRKVLRNKVTDNFLEEYGLDDYSSITKKTDDYNDIYDKKRPKQLIDISSDKLDGYIIGQAPVDNSRVPQSRTLTEQEIEENHQREVKAEQNRLYNDIRNKFNPSAPIRKSKVLEINNIDETNSKHVSDLNNRIIGNINNKVQNDYSLDDDLDLLLGGSTQTKHNPEESVQSTPIDDLLQSLAVEEKAKTKNSTGKSNHVQVPIKDQDFLDDLLG